MKSMISFLFLVLALISTTAQAEIRTVPYVDVSRYLGDWYQISHIPLWFEGIEDCACARQRLAATPEPGVISVVNTCTKRDRSPYLISGTASSDDSKSNAKFTVAFEGVPFKGSYWIIGLDAQYRYAVVTDKSGQALYILSKTPQLARNLYDEAVAIAAKQVNVSELKGTVQSGCSYPQ